MRDCGGSCGAGKVEEAFNGELLLKGGVVDYWEFFKAFAGPIATVFASLTAVGVAVTFGIIQARISRSQAETAAAQKDIAKGQLNIALERMKHDLFEKRFAVFEVARQLLIRAVQHDHVDAGEIIKFNMETADAEFLYNEDIVDYLDSLRSRIVRLRQVNTQIKSIEDNERLEKRRGELIDKAADIAIELSAELPIMIAKFKPYLKLGSF